MSCYHNHRYKTDHTSDGYDEYEQERVKDAKDVLTVPDEVVQLVTEVNQTRWTFGSIGLGFEVAGQVWRQHEHIFSSHTHEIKMKKISRTARLGPPTRVRQDIFEQYQVDGLVIDKVDGIIWKKWLDKARPANHPKIILVFSDGDQLIKEDGIMGKGFHTDMKRHGYDTRYWMMRAWEYGAALDQVRLVTIFWQRTFGGEIVQPTIIALPARAMSNLLMPVGVPIRAWTNQVMGPAVIKKGIPCIVGRIGIQDVYGCQGIMPDTIPSWIQTHKGIRRLQHQELAKAKGYLEESEMPHSKGGLNSVRMGTCGHIVTAAMDRAGEWLKEFGCSRWNNNGAFANGYLVGTTTDPLQSDTTTKNVQDDDAAAATMWSTDEEDEADPDWDWEVPDISVGSTWYKERISKLKEATKDSHDGDRWFCEGIECLDRHRMNYTEAGPKRLQLLWWEFPKEHWKPLREGCLLGFLITPSGELKLNGKLSDDKQTVAGSFVDKLIELGVLLPATEDLIANCPLFCVDKAYDSDQKHCIANCKEGGQNACMGKDPVYLTQKEAMLIRLYFGGWTGIADASKQLHNFKTHPSERKYLGCIHPTTGLPYVYGGLPMGTTNSPPIACRINNAAMRQLIDECELFQGTPMINTWAQHMKDGSYDHRRGHGRILMGADGLPACMIFTIVDDYFIHGPTKRKCRLAFSAFMDYMVRLGFICQKVKTSPPRQRQKFCGMLWDTKRIPTILIPTDKISRFITTIDYILLLDDQDELSRLSASICGGLLQSLIEATPSRIGQVYLRRLYDDVHHTIDLYGKSLYYTVMQLSSVGRQDLAWWKAFLESIPGNASCTGSMASLTVTWGDGSGTGTGGTSELVACGDKRHDEIETWMGTWAPHVSYFDSNWQELRTLSWTLERKLQQPSNQIQGGTLFYFTDNMVTYYIVNNGSARNPDLHKVVRDIKAMEIKLKCRVEVVHVPGKTMIIQGTDGLSRGVWVSADRLQRSSVEESRLALQGIPFNEIMGKWALRATGLPMDTAYQHHSDLSSWAYADIDQQWSIWTPSPEIARQAISHFLDYWVEHPWYTGAIFLIPRVFQRQWGHLSKSITELGIFQPRELPWGARYESLIPFVCLVCYPHVRTLPKPEGMESVAIPKRLEWWHLAQAEQVRRMR
jgi:hypothetical protein